MRKSKKILSVTLALIIALSTLIVGTSAITVNAATPSKVTLVSTAYNTNATVTLGWTAASGANGYQIAKKRITDKGYTYLTATGTSYNDKKVITGTIYYYQVRAFYKSGKNITYGAWSNSKSITTLYRPTVTSLNYLNNNLLNINWNKILGVSHYKLAFKRTIDKAWNYRNVKNTYFNVSNPTKGTTYTIQVCPMNGTIAGQWSLVKSITIKYVPVKVSSIKLSQTSLSLTLGNSKTLSATVTPSNADNKVLQWSSSNTKVATVNQSGKVTSVSTGTATIYAKATDGSGKQATCSVTVTGIKVSSITVSPTSVSLKPGETKSITATVSPANAENKNLQWTSSNTKVATVNQSGTVTAVSDGTATIYARALDGSGKQATCSVTVKSAAAAREKINQWLQKNGKVNGRRIQADFKLTDDYECHVWNSLDENLFVFNISRPNKNDKRSTWFHISFPTNADPPEIIKGNLMNLTNYYNYIYTSDFELYTKTGQYKLKMVTTSAYGTQDVAKLEFDLNMEILNTVFGLMGTDSVELGLLPSN